MGGVVRHLAVSGLEAAESLVLMLGCNGGRIPVFVDNGAHPAFGLSCDDGKLPGGRLWARAERLDFDESRQVTVGLPTVKGDVGWSMVLWAWVTGSEQLARAARFKPAPTMVLRFGDSSDRLMLWALKKPIPWAMIEPHNDRVAYALGASRARCQGEYLRVPLPGTFLRVRRSRPSPVLVTRLDLTAVYDLAQVTGRLKDAPSKDAWRTKK